MEIRVVRNMMSTGTVNPTATAKVRETLKAVARLVYNQEKLTQEYHPRVRIAHSLPFTNMEQLITRRFATAAIASPTSFVLCIGRVRRKRLRAVNVTLFPWRTWTAPSWHQHARRTPQA